MRRTLGINKTKLWVVEPISEIEAIDDDGNYTGEITNLYDTPVEVYLTLYPSNGAIVEQLFGKDASLDMVAVSNSVELTKDSLLFINEPLITDDFFKTHDYSVQNIKRSLNTFQYGLRKRT